MGKCCICFDTETTGFGDDDEVLSLCIIGVNAIGEESVLFSEYFKPIRKTEWPDAECINHISPESVKDKKPLSEYKEQIEDILINFDLWIGHNIQYDLRMLSQSGIKVPDTFSRCVLDIMLDYASFNHCKWPKLTYLAAKYGFQFLAHDAEEDTRATLYCARKMYKEVFDENN